MHLPSAEAAAEQLLLEKAPRPEQDILSLLKLCICLSPVLRYSCLSVGNSVLACRQALHSVCDMLERFVRAG